jgi:hypothetical protein
LTSGVGILILSMDRVPIYVAVIKNGSGDGAITISPACRWFRFDLKAPHDYHDT